MHMQQANPRHPRHKLSRPEKSRNSLRNILILVAVALLPAIGFAVMRMIIYIMPVSDNDHLPRLLFTILIFFMGLAVPYAMLKLGFHFAHRRNPAEKEFELRDIPKDKQELADDALRREGRE